MQGMAEEKPFGTEGKNTMKRGAAGKPERFGFVTKFESTDGEAVWHFAS